jgi:hypothetical protein
VYIHTYVGIVGGYSITNKKLVKRVSNDEVVERKSLYDQAHQLKRVSFFHKKFLKGLGNLVAATSTLG